MPPLFPTYLPAMVNYWYQCCQCWVAVPAYSPRPECHRIQHACAVYQYGQEVADKMRENGIRISELENKYLRVQAELHQKKAELMASYHAQESSGYSGCYGQNHCAVYPATQHDEQWHPPYLNDYHAYYAPYPSLGAGGWWALQHDDWYTPFSHNDSVEESTANVWNTAGNRWPSQQGESYAEVTGSEWVDDAACSDSRHPDNLSAVESSRRDTPTEVEESPVDSACYTVAIPNVTKDVQLPISDCLCNPRDEPGECFCSALDD